MHQFSAGRPFSRRWFLRQSLQATACLPLLPGLIRRSLAESRSPLPLADLHVHLADTLSLERVDYVLMDALELPEEDGSFLLTWLDETEVPDPQSFMDRAVDFYVRILEDEGLDILASPTFLPKAIRHHYGRLWTESRMRRVIDAAVANEVAIEINAMYRIPSPAFVRRARAAGARFTFGTNGRTEEVVGVLDYSVSVAEACGLTADDLWPPDRAPRRM